MTNKTRKGLLPLFLLVCALLPPLSAQGEVKEIRIANEFIKMLEDGISTNDVYILTEDINLQGRVISCSSKDLLGIFDGQGHVVSNFTFNNNNPTDKSKKSCGLFSTITGVFQNVVFCDVTIAASSKSSSAMGLVAGSLSGLVSNCTFIRIHADCSTGFNFGIVAGNTKNGHIEDCTVIGCTLTNSQSSVGGIVGTMGFYENSTDNLVKRCRVIGSTIQSTLNCGGILGWMSDYGSIEDCYVSATNIDGSIAAGGIIGGLAESNTFTRNYFYGLISNNCRDAGTFCGISIKTVTSNNFIYDGELLPYHGPFGDCQEAIFNNLHNSDITKMTNAPLMESVLGGGDGWVFRDGCHPTLVDQLSSQYGSPSGKNSWGEPLDDNLLIIKDAKGLAAFRDNVNRGFTYEGCKVQLWEYIDNNLDMSDYGDFGAPIGCDGEHPFMGEFDGNGKTITGLYMSQSAGLFGTVSNAYIHDLTLKDAYYGRQSTGNGGGLIGAVAYGASYVENCHVTLKDILGGNNATRCFGGILGEVLVENNYAYATIRGCSYEGRIEGGKNYGVVGEPGRSSLSYNYYIMAYDLIHPIITPITGSSKGNFYDNLGLVPACHVQAAEGITLEFDDFGDGWGNPGVAINGADVGLTITNNKGYEDYVATAGKLTHESGNHFILRLDTFRDLPLIILGTESDYQDTSSGTADDPYIITTTSQMELLAMRVNEQGETYHDKHFRLDADLDFSGKTYIPIGNSTSNTFQGTFDGNGHTIANISTGSDNRYAGVFGLTSNGATVKNLVVGGTSKIYGTEIAGGIIAGNFNNDLTITNCRVEAGVTVITMGGFAGGIIGLFSPPSTMTGCLMEGIVRNDGNNYLNPYSFSNGLYGGEKYYGYYNAGEMKDCVFTGILSYALSTSANIHFYAITADPDINLTPATTTPPTHYDVSGITSYDNLMVCNGALYTTSPQSSHTICITYQREGYTANSLEATNGATLDKQDVSEEIDGNYLLTIAADNTEIRATTTTPISYTINYYLNGGTADNPITYNVESDGITLTTPTRDNYIFTGWTGTDLQSITKTVIIPHGSTGDRSYTAYWMPDAEVWVEYAPNNETITHFNSDHPEGGNIIIGRTLYGSGQWNTLCLPFTVDLNDEDCPLRGATVRELSDAHLDGNELLLDFSGADVTTLEAGKPYLVKWEGSDNGSFFFTKVAATDATPQAIVASDGSVTFAGTYAPVVIPSEGDRTKIYLDADTELHWPNDAMAINSFHAFFQLGDGIYKPSTYRIVLGDGEEFAGTLYAFYKGDLNHDDMVSSTDVTLLVDCILGEESAWCDKNQADIDGNGNISVTDITTLVDLILNGGEATLPGNGGNCSYAR